MQYSWRQTSLDPPAQIKLDLPPCVNSGECLLLHTLIVNRTAVFKVLSLWRWKRISNIQLLQWSGVQYFNNIFVWCKVNSVIIPDHFMMVFGLFCVAEMLLWGIWWMYYCRVWRGSKLLIKTKWAITWRLAMAGHVSRAHYQLPTSDTWLGDTWHLVEAHIHLLDHWSTKYYLS